MTNVPEPLAGLLGQRVSLEASARIRVIMFALALAASFAAVAGLTWWIGGFEQEFHSDATGHYITGLALHDLVFGGGLRNPLGFLLEYFVHYPAIGLGHWPPAFHLIEAGWISIFGAAKPSIVLLVVLMAAATAATIFVTAAARWGVFAGLVGAVMFAVSPLVLATYGNILIDVLVALWCILAALAFLKYMKGRGWLWSILFAFLAAAAILTKGNAMMLSLFPGMVLVFAGRFDLLRRPSFWVAAAVVAVLVLPWYVLTYSWSAKGFLFEWGLEYSSLALIANLRTLFRALGVGGVALFLIGIVAAWRDPRNALLAQGCLALILACFLFQAIVPTALETRYMIPALPPILVLIGAGVGEVCKRWQRPLVAMPAVLAVAILPLVPGISAVPHAEPWGLASVVDAALAELPPNNPVILAAAGPHAETVVVAEAAERDRQRPSLVVIRGSRLLGGGGFMNRDYVPLYDNIEGVLGAISAHKIPLVVLEISPEAARWAHNAQVRELCERHPNLFQVVRRVPSQRGGEFWLIKVTDYVDSPADWEALRALGRPKRKMPGE